MGLPVVCFLSALLLLLALQEGNHLTRAQASAAMAHVRRPLKRPHLQNMVFYMHDMPGATSVVVAAQNGNLRPPSKLGVTHIFDNKLTEKSDPSSTEIGRGQGLYTLASLTGFDDFMTLTAVFHKPAVYNGSTICLQGADRALPEREISVVGGTGHFRFVRGYAILSTVSFKAPNAIIKFNVTLLHL